MIDTQQIKRQVDLLALIGHDTRLEKCANTNGGEWAGACPLCGNGKPKGHDRLRVQPERGLWWCRQCVGSKTKQWQDCFAYVMRRDNCDFITAAATCAKFAGQPAPGQRLAPQPARPAAKPASDPPQALLEITERCTAALWSAAGERARDYLRGRGLADDTIRAARLGLMPAPGFIGGLQVPKGITIPWTQRGQVTAVNVRYPIQNKRGQRYQLIAGSKRGLYGLDWLSGAADVIVVEGELDALLCWQVMSLVADVVTLGSATAYVPDDCLPFLLKAKHFWIATDNDPQGEQAAERWRAVVGQRGQRLYFPHKAKDATQAYQNGLDIAAWLVWAMGYGSEP